MSSDIYLCSYLFLAKIGVLKKRLIYNLYIQTRQIQIQILMASRRYYSIDIYD